MSESASSLRHGVEAVMDVWSSVAGLARDGVIAGMIKLASAALSFLMFVAIAKVTDAREFGLFSAVYAGASLVSFFASVGQQATVLRFWPEYAGAGDLRSAHGLMARAIVVTLIGLAVTSLLVAAVGLFPALGRDASGWFALCTSAAVLSFALGWSEFTSGAFRAKNALISGLLPRDVLWRAVTVAIVAALWHSHVTVSAVTATLLTAVPLLVVTLPQAVVLLSETLKAERGPLTREQRAEFASVTLGLWGVTSLPPALGQVSTLLVAAILGPEIAGAVFVADRTTRLVALALHGINQALAPQISGAFYRGNRAYVQRITSLTALGSFSIAICVLALFWFFGGFILSIFDPAYATPSIHIVLILFGAGATVVTGCGPIEVLLQLTGLQHALLKLLIVVNVLGLAATALGAEFFGPVGAAVAIAATVITWNVIAVAIARNAIGIDPSLLGFLRRRPVLRRELVEGRE